jgi:hypothetical protein
MVTNYKSARPMLTILTKPKKPRFTISNPSMDLEERMMVTKNLIFANKHTSELGCLWAKWFLTKRLETFLQGILKGEEVSRTVDLQFDWFGISCMTTHNFCFYLQNRKIQTRQTGGQRYSDTSPLVFPAFCNKEKN